MGRHTNRILAGVTALMAVTVVAALAFFAVRKMQSSEVFGGEFSLSQVGYDSIGKYSEKLAPVEIYNQWGYCDNRGTVQIVPQFSAAGEFSCGLAAVQESEGGLYGYIDKQGNYILEPQYFYAGSFSEELAACGVKSDKLRGYINKTGEFIIPEKYYETGSFSEGLSKVKTTADGLYFYIDKNDKVVIPEGYKEASDFSEGMAAVSVNGLWGYIDNQGTMVIQPRFIQAHPFHEELAAVKLDDVWGYIDKTGNFVIENCFGEADDFAGGFAPVQFCDNGLWGYISNRGKAVINGAYLQATGFSEGVAAVKENSQWILVTDNNYKVVPPVQGAAEVLADDNEISKTVSNIAQEIINDNPGFNLEQDIQLSLGESVQLSGFINMDKIIEKLILKVVGEDGEDKGIYLSIKPDSDSYNLNLVSVDSRIEPFNVPGKYTLQLMAKLEGSMEEIKVGEINAEVLDTQKAANLTVDIGRIDSSEYPIINLFVSVFDKKGISVSNLTPDSFKLYETFKEQDEQEQKLQQVLQPSEEEGLKVALVFDSSLSMYNDNRTGENSNMEFAKNSAVNFIDTGGFRDNDLVSILSFGKNFTVNQDFTDNRNKLITAVKGIVSQPDTAIYDAIIHSADTLSEQKGKKCIILFTDGEDTVSKSLFTDSIESAVEKGIPVYTIAIGEKAKTNELKSISDKTGGAFYYLKDTKELNNIYKDITNKLKFQYQLTYTSKADATAGQSTKIKLVVTNNSDSITTEKMY